MALVMSRSRTTKSAKIARFEAAFLLLAELCEGGGLGVGVDGLVESDLFLRLEGLVPASFWRVTAE